jgi:hypothetical protein
VARKKVVRRLPPLPKLRAFDVKEHKTELLLETLRLIATGAQEERARAFYSMREVASRFRAPISTVADVYQRLEREGIVRMVRGSQTTLRGLKYDRKLSVRAFVGLPTFMSRFVTIQDYRMFFMTIRRQLRLNGFATALLYIESGEEEELIGSARRYEVDTIIWFQPAKFAKKTFPGLKDLGIRVIGINDGGLPSIPCHYEVGREKAIKTILRNWRTDPRVRSVIVISGGRRSSAGDEQRIQELLEEEGLDYEFNSASSKSVPRFLESLNQKKNIGIIFLSSAASMFAFRAPEAVASICRRCRVALIEGPVNMPFARVPDVEVDLVLTDWQSIAARIVSDLIAQHPFDDEKGVVFGAEALLQVPLSRYAQAI